MLRKLSLGRVNHTLAFRGKILAIRYSGPASFIGFSLSYLGWTGAVVAIN